MTAPNKEYEDARRYALSRLSKSSQHSKQLKQALERRLVSKETSERVINECRRMGFLNDEEWLRHFVSQHVAKHVGTKSILYKLMNKDIDREEAEAVLEELVGKEDESEHVRTLLETKYKRRNLEDYKERNKVIASLMRKGFSFEAIKKGLDRK